MAFPFTSRSDAYAVIMAGGRGERFWPQSRLSHPKQLLRLLGNLTLIEQTVERLLPIFVPDHIVVITNSDYVAPMRTLLSNLPPRNIIGEPVGRDTAPCIAAATAFVRSVSPASNPLLCFLPADHIINDVESFDCVIADALTVAAAAPRIVTIGITPTAPSTGYGYIRIGEILAFDTSTPFFEGCGFKEKPAADVAESYLRAGSYQWNSGIFVMAADTLIQAFDDYAPDLKSFLVQAQVAFATEDVSAFNSAYASVRRISIDYAVMEHVKNVVIARASFDWDDVGSWTSMRNQLRPESGNNVVRGLHLGIDTSDCVIVGNPKHLIATVDVKDLIIVHTDDATLVCSGNAAQRIKEVVQLIASKPELKSFL